jgi:signal transduction histidine kinase
LQSRKRQERPPEAKAMKVRHGATAFSSLAPWRVFLLILAVVFAIEAVVMLVLPFVLPPESGRRLETLVDACTLTVVLAPVLWSVVISPLRRLAESRRQLLRRVISAQEDERRRISRDLHDEIGQGLTSLLVGLRTLEESATFEAAKERARELRLIGGQVHDEIRRLARGLRPSVLDDLGLAEAVARYAEDYEQTHGIAVSVRLPDRDAGRMPEAVETALYRMTQEALTNVARHAAATRVDLVVARDRSCVRLKVADDGRGFDPGVLRGMPGRGSFGLSGMAERAALLNGVLAVESRAGGGTTLTVEIPLRETTDAEDPGTRRG